MSNNAELIHEIPPLNEEKPLNGDKRMYSCITKEIYQLINDKKNQLQALKKERETLLENFNENNQFLFQKQELLTNAMTKRANIQFLKEELAKHDKKLGKNKEEIEFKKRNIYKKKQMLDIYMDKIEKCKDLIKKSELAAHNKANNEKDGLKANKLKLIEHQKQRIDELNRFIFELTEIKPKEEDVLQKSTRTNTLKDARQTVYVNGRWLTSNDQVIYRIVRSILPTDGDYMLYYKDANQNVDDATHAQLLDEYLNDRQNKNSFTNSFSSKLIDRFTILSGLTYTVQFVNLIAFYLNILLPYNLTHSKFYNSNDDNQFQNAIAKLNTNIIYLSLNQHLPVNDLLPKHTLENLHYFLAHFKEMKIKVRDNQSISFPSHMIPLLDEMFTEPTEDDLNYMMQNSIPNLLYNDNDEWETVPNSSEIPSDDCFNQINANLQQQHRTVSTSLISSVLSQFWYKNNNSSK